MMADGRGGDIGSNAEVFDDVDTDPSNILQNVEQSCTKILIPSMAQPSIMSKITTPDDDDNDENDANIFPTLSSSDEAHESKFVVDDEKSKRLLSVSSSPFQRTVRWSLSTMAEAMDSVFGGDLTTTQAAKKYEVPRTTLLDRLSMKIKSQHLEAPGTFPLSPENDAKVVDFVMSNPALDKPTLIKGILCLAEDLAREQGKPFETPLNVRKWLKLFVYKHPKLDIIQCYRRRSYVSYQTSSYYSTPSHSRMSANASSNGRSSTNLSSSLGVGSTSNQSMQLASPKYHQQQIMHHQQQQNLLETNFNSQMTSIAENVESDYNENSPHASVQVDHFEANLAKQAVHSIELKLTSEHQSYFNYRFVNSALDRGYELWRHCKAKIENADQENFEAVLSCQALAGIEQALSSDHLKYFRFRYENPELEEGYKLWHLLKSKSA